MDEFEEKISLYHSILQLEDWLEIKHNPNILKEVYDIMAEYHCNLEQMWHEYAYSCLDDTEEGTSMVSFEDIDDSEKKRQIEEAYKELDAIKQQQIKNYQSMMELDNIASESIQQAEDDIFYEKLPLFKQIQDLEESCGIAHKPNVLELSEDDMWKYYLELMDMPSKKEISSERKIIVVENKIPLIDYSGDDLSLDPNMW
ncbi:MAG: hypothetical protein PUF00_09940 [Paraprevotella sp.]|nr:hypothetical protein [Paraprevotella sp.]